MEARVLYLYHGTKRCYLDDILAKGFHQHINNQGGLYGLGCYFATEMCKALQYTDRVGDRYVFKRRVFMGRSYETSDALKKLRSPSELDTWYRKGWLLHKPEGERHSVLVNSGRKRGGSGW